MFRKQTSTKGQKTTESRTTLKTARKKLDAYTGGPDTAKYKQLNKAVNDAEQALPWHRR